MNCEICGEENTAIVCAIPCVNIAIKPQLCKWCCCFYGIDCKTTHYNTVIKESKMNIQIGGHYRDRMGQLLRCTGISDPPESLYVCAVVGPVQKHEVQRRTMFLNGQFLINVQHYWDFVEEIK